MALDVEIRLQRFGARGLPHRHEGCPEIEQFCKGKRAMRFASVGIQLQKRIHIISAQDCELGILRLVNVEVASVSALKV